MLPSHRNAFMKNVGFFALFMENQEFGEARIGYDFCLPLVR